MALQYSIQSELMPNHLPGSAVSGDSLSYVSGVTGIGGKPLVFAKTSPTQFCAFISSETNPSCWEQVDLSSQLVGSQQLIVVTVCVKQKADGSLRMAIAFNSENTHIPTLFYAESLQPFTDPDAWKDIKNSFKVIPFEDKLSISSIDFGEESKALDYVYARIEFAEDSSQSKVWACPVSDNAMVVKPYQIDFQTYVFSFAAGRARMSSESNPTASDVLSGVYIAWDRNIKSLWFYSPPTKQFPQKFNYWNLGIPDTPPKLAAKTFFNGNPDELTSLYTLTDSVIQCWTPDMQTNRVAPTQSVTLTGADSFAFSSIAGSPNWPTHDLFILARHVGDNAYNDLLQGVTRSDGSIDMPLKIDTKVYSGGLKPFAWRSPGSSKPQCCLHLINCYPDGNTPIIDFFMRIQDCTTGVWQTQPITLGDQTGYHEVTSFTTHIRITDENNNPKFVTEFLLKPSYSCNVYMAGKLIHFDGIEPQRVKTDGGGQITIMMASHRATAPQWTISETGTDATPQTFDPKELMCQRLQAIKSKDQIKNAQRSSGGALFPNGISDQACQDAMGALDKINTILASMQAAPEVPGITYENKPMKKTDIVRSTVFHYRAGQPLEVTVYQGAHPGYRDADFFTTIGNLLDHLWTELKQAATDITWAIVEGDVKKLVLTIGHFVYEAVITLSPTMELVNWALQLTLGITTDDIVDWLGFVFNWDDILLTKEGLKGMINTSLKYAENQLILKGSELIDTYVQKICTWINGGIPNYDPHMAPYLNSTPANIGGLLPDANTGQLVTPQGMWGFNKILDYGDDAQTNIPSPVSWIMPVLTKEQQDVISRFITKLNGLNIQVGDWTKMSLLDIIKEVITIVAEEAVILVGEILKYLVNQIAEMLKTVQDMFNETIDIPVVSSLYKSIAGSELCVMDLICLAAAIPFNVFWKTINHQSPFTQAMVDQIKVTSQTGDLEMMFNVFNTNKMSSTGAPSPGPIFVLLASAVLHFGSASFFTCQVVKVARKDETGMDFWQKFEIGADYAVSGLSLAFTAYDFINGKFPDSNWNKELTAMSLVRNFVYRTWDLVKLWALKDNKELKENINVVLDFICGVEEIVLTIFAGTELSYFNWPKGDDLELRGHTTRTTIVMWSGVAALDIFGVPQYLFKKDPEATLAILALRGVADHVLWVCLLTRAICALNVRYKQMHYMGGGIV